MKSRRRLHIVSFVMFGAVIIAACSQDKTASDNEDVAIDGNGSANSTQPEETIAPNTVDPISEPTDSGPVLLAPEDPPRGAEQQFSTDFSIHTIPYADILSGGPPKDGIPSIDEPKFINVPEADEWLKDLEPVTVFQEGGDTRIYPLQVLIWHEIVNDIVGGRAVAVTFCPLCNTTIIFDASVEGMNLDFGTTGRLRFSNLLMYDRQTETWWQQATGEAVIGELTGTQLTFLPALIIGWKEAMDTFPDAQVLSRDTGYSRDYGRNPYVGYDNVQRSPFLYVGPSTPGQLPSMARVTTVDLNGEAVAYPNDVLASEIVVNDNIGGQGVVVIWQPGLASALDSSDLASGQDVGANAVFLREIDGQELTFVLEGGRIIDEQTRSEWNVLGQAISGDLEGKQLAAVVKVDHFWFSWAAFRPDTRVYQP
ncbi:MAG: DUF3179 domain-containing protein [Chloroflexi bacterium]|nr:DUF3179 domain-containing protein [Chloroflexota bacterium]